MPGLIVRRALAVLGIGAAAALAVAGPAAAQAPTGPCGFSENFTGAYYNHCGSGQVQVRIVKSWPFAEDPEICVGPGMTYLGKTDDIENAFYVHPCG